MNKHEQKKNSGSRDSRRFEARNVGDLILEGPLKLSCPRALALSMSSLPQPGVGQDYERAIYPSINRSINHLLDIARFSRGSGIEFLHHFTVARLELLRKQPTWVARRDRHRHPDCSLGKGKTERRRGHWKACCDFRPVEDTPCRRRHMPHPTPSTRSSYAYRRMPALGYAGVGRGALNLTLSGSTRATLAGDLPTPSAHLKKLGCDGEPVAPG